MKKILKNYKSTLILLGAIIIGAIVGLIFKEKSTVLSPFGDIFINLMFVVIVPLIFLTITTAIIKMDNPKRLTKIVLRVVLVFVIMSFISALIGLASTCSVKLVDNNNTNVTSLLDESSEIDNDLSILERTANLLTVSDFNLLLSKNNIIAILVFAIIFGLAIRKSKEKESPGMGQGIALGEVFYQAIRRCPEPSWRRPPSGSRRCWRRPPGCSPGRSARPLPRRRRRCCP